MIMAANGYIVIAPQPSLAFPASARSGTVADLSGDYGGQNMQDYYAATDYIKGQPYVDADHVGAIGASYGGFSVYWLAGHNDGRYAALVAHAGIFNVEAQYLETEEMWFADFRSRRPLLGQGRMPLPSAHTQNSLPTATSTTGRLRCSSLWENSTTVFFASQGMMAFNAAKMHGLEAEMVVFPDENHWVIKPQNAILWQRCFRFLDKYLKTDK